MDFGQLGFWMWWGEDDADRSGMPLIIKLPPLKDQIVQKKKKKTKNKKFDWIELLIRELQIGF